MKTVPQQLIDYLKSVGCAVASGDLQRMTWRNRSGTTAVPRSVVRRLEELVEDGTLKVEYRGKHAWYQIAEEHQKKKQVVEQLPGGNVRISYVPA